MATKKKKRRRSKTNVCSCPICRAQNRPVGRPPFEPTAKQRGEVEALAIANFTQGEIAEYIGDGIDEKTLRLHFRDELDNSQKRTKAKVAMNIIRLAVGAPAQYSEGCAKCGDANLLRAEVVPQLGAMCFYMKTQAKAQGWTERVEHTGKDGGPIEFDFSKLTDAELDIVEQARAILARIAPAGAFAFGERETTH